MIPKTGEYWYVKCCMTHYTDFDDYRRINSVGDILVIKRIELVGDQIHYISHNGYTKPISATEFVKKWEPNWLWKLLGYV